MLHFHAVLNLLVLSQPVGLMFIFLRPGSRSHRGGILDIIVVKGYISDHPGYRKHDEGHNIMKINLEFPQYFSAAHLLVFFFPKLGTSRRAYVF